MRPAQQDPPEKTPMFRTILPEKSADAFCAMLRDLSSDDLGQQAGSGGVVADLAHSTINYKDGLANRSPVVRTWRMVPSIDGAGTVASSRHPAFATGDLLIFNGWGVGKSYRGASRAGRDSRVTG